METTDNRDIASASLVRAAIDRSVKGPVLFLFTSAAIWLLVATLMGLIASLKLVSPDFLDNSWLWFSNYGRLQPAHMVALIYGWALQAGLGVSLWLLARRSGRPLERGSNLLIVSGLFWNIGVALGVGGILAGAGTSLQWLEFPPYVCPLLLLSFAIIAFRLIVHRQRLDRQAGFTLASSYIQVGLVCFPWIFATTTIVLHRIAADVPLGSFGSGVNAWYVSTLILLVLAPLGLGACYYFIPKITGQPIYSFQLAQIGFWGLIVLGGWTGMQKYMGGPLPAWMPTIGGMATLLLLVPAGIVALNHHLTTRGKHEMIESSPTLRFIFVGSFSFVVTCVVQALIGNFWTGASLQFSHAEYGFHQAAIYGFFSMSMFGAIYYITPRLTGCEWLSARLIRNHFWFSVYGIAAMVVCMIVGGLAQGQSANNPDNWDQSFVGAIRNARGYLIGRSLSWGFILWSNGWFLIHLAFMVLGLGRRSVTPTLLHREHGEPEPTESAA